MVNQPKLSYSIKSTVNQLFIDGEIIIGAGGNFKLGLFSPDNSIHKFRL